MAADIPGSRSGGPSFYADLATILNSDQSHSVILCGNVYDLYEYDGKYLPLIPFVCAKSQTKGIYRLIYELNGPIRVLDEPDRLRNAWITWRAGVDFDTLLVKGMQQRKGATDVERLGQEFDNLLIEAIGNPTVALETLRQLTFCSRASHLNGHLLIFIEAADMLLPAGNGDVSSLNDGQLRRISIVQDWFSDPNFMQGGDSVVLVAESRSMIHPRVARLPQVLPVEIAAPTTQDRGRFIENFVRDNQPAPKLWGPPEQVASFAAGLSLHAVRQLLKASCYCGEAMTPGDVVGKVEEFIQSQVGDDIVEFKKPTHTLENIVGCTGLKKFIRDELLPRFRGGTEGALSGAAIAGPIGGGKTYLFEAVASEMDAPVLVLKGIRSQWYGQTDVIFERLRRVLEALDKVVIFVDEADTQFGSVGEESHSTERRLTGKIQAMMSDSRLRGRVIWLLMTARIHLLSPDIRRPGRVGDLIIPVLDPVGDDRREFIRWTIKPVLNDPTEPELDRIDSLTVGYSAAAFTSLRSRLKGSHAKSLEDLETIVRDQIEPAIGLTRRYQTLQALVNCTRRSLLPDPNVTDAERESWQRELALLEQQGID